MRNATHVLRYTGKARAAIDAALAANDSLREFIIAPTPTDPTYHTALVRNYTYAGGGITFLLDALRNLCGPGPKVDLGQAFNMDHINRAAFIAMLTAYLA